MTLLQRFTREPNAIVGLIVAGFGLLVIFNVINPSPEQVGGLATFGGAIVLALRWLVTPSAEVVIQEQPGETLLAGRALGSVAAGRELDSFVAKVDERTSIHRQPYRYLR